VPVSGCADCGLCFSATAISMIIVTASVTATTKQWIFPALADDSLGCLGGDRMERVVGIRK
jgi:hypothetical protein